jgi:hypothetical protein
MKSRLIDRRKIRWFNHRMPPPKPSVMSAAQFFYSTTPPFYRKSLSYIDDRLAWFHDHSSSHDHENNISLLVDVFDQISNYERAKREKYKAKTSKNLANRWGVVRTLKREIFSRIQYESFLMRKDSGAKAAAAALSGSYQLERQHFEALKQQPVKKGFFSSGRQVDTSPYAMTTAKLNNQGTDFSQMTLIQFTQMMDAVPRDSLGLRVYYVRTSDRISKYMVVCVNDLWYQNAVMVSGFYMYALDKYGNLLVGPIQINNSFPDGKRQKLAIGYRYNHSGLAAGAPVVCAGELEFNRGKIIELNNCSGHYAPSVQQLHDAVTCLVEEHEADLAGCKLRIFDSSPDVKYVDNAMDFYRNINCVKRTR